jgi:low temperature requirement protein LtrA
MSGVGIIFSILLFVFWCWLMQTLFHVKYRSEIAYKQTKLLELIARKLGATEEEINKAITENEINEKD